MACEYQIVPPVGQPGEHLPIGSGYGSRIDPVSGETGDWHAGIDIPAAKFTPVRAAMDGVIAKSYYSETGGNVIYVNHGSGLETRYMHLAYPSLYNIGALVRAGTQISAVGDTGRVTGAHLHFEMRLNDKNFDPTDCYNNATTQYVNPYTVPDTYSGATEDYTAPPPATAGNKFPWIPVLIGVGVLGTVIIAWPRDDNKPKPVRKRRKQSTR